MKNLLKLGKTVRNRQRKIIFNISLILMSFIFFTMYSCNKETGLKMTKEKVLNKENPIQKVKAFKKMLESYKNGDLELRTTYTKDELIWNIEANLNYTYSEPGLTYDNYAIETDTFVVPELGGSMPPSVVDRVNDEVLDSIICFFHSVLFSDKRLKLVDVFPINGQNSIGVNTIVGNYNNSLPSGSFSFEFGDDWNAFSGKCDDPYNPSNGGNEVAIATNINVGTSSSIINPWFFTNIENFEYNSFEDYNTGYYWVELNENDLNPGDDIMDYHLWKAHSSSDDVMCLEYDEMNYYLANAEYEALRIEPFLNKTFMHMNIVPSVVPGTGINGSPSGFAVWVGDGKYGVKHLIELNEVDSYHLDLYAELCN